MKLASSLLLAATTAAATLLAPAIAAAQPAGPPPPPPPGGYYSVPTTLPGGFQDRRGRLALGVGLGLGAMSSDSGSVDCANCDYGTATVSVDFHIGGFIAPRLALLLELQANGQTVEVHEGGSATKQLWQTGILGAAQFWVTPRVWLKGGLGFAHLENTYSDYYGDQAEPLDNGGALLLGGGVELLQSQNFAIDLEGRFFTATYHGIDDQISSGTIGVGLSWY